MPEAIELVKIIKKAAIDAVESTKPVQIFFGTVENTNPIRINVEQKMVLGEKQLILTRNVTDYETGIQEGKEGDIKKYIVFNGLQPGDKVLLVRQQGGQKYIVWDKVIT